MLGAADAAPARRLPRDRDARLRRDRRRASSRTRDERPLRRSARSTSTNGAPGHHADRQDRPPAGTSRFTYRSSSDRGTTSRWRWSCIVAVRQLPPARLAPRAAPGSRSARTRSRPRRWASTLVRTKLLAYAIGAALRRLRRRVPGVLPEHGQRRPVRVRVLGLHPRDGHPRRHGHIWGVMLGAIALSFINSCADPRRLNGVPGKLGLDFDAHASSASGSSASCS